MWVCLCAVSFVGAVTEVLQFVIAKPPFSEKPHPCYFSYDAWVIYNFLSLCLAWVGGPGAVVVSLSGRSLKPSWILMTCCYPAIPLDGCVSVLGALLSNYYNFLKLSVPLLNSKWLVFVKYILWLLLKCCLTKKSLVLDRRFIRRCKQGCLQFVILKPILVVITFILYAKGKYKDGNFSVNQSYLYITIIYTISYSMALYALALFYAACRDLLRPYNPVPKFIMIKSVVFLTYWQVNNFQVFSLFTLPSM